MRVFYQPVEWQANQNRASYLRLGPAGKTPLCAIAKKCRPARGEIVPIRENLPLKVACPGNSVILFLQKFAQMNFLITGGAGFIGSHIVEHLQNQAEIRVLANLRSGFQRDLGGLRHKFIFGSILDRELVRRALRDVVFIFHLAALTSVPESLQKPVEYTKVFTRGTLVVLEEAARAKVKKLVLSSSAAIYGDSLVMPKVETLPPEPISPYAVTTLDGEYYCHIFTREGRLPTTRLRYFNVFDPRQDSNSHYAAAVPLFIQQAIRNESIVTFGDGEQTPDFIYVKDVAAANVFCATFGCYRLLQRRLWAGTDD